MALSRPNEQDAGRDLEQLELVDTTTGEPRIGVDDRLVAIRAARGGELVQAIRTPPGLYLTEAQPDFGLGGRCNLFITTWAERALGTRGGAG